MKTNLVFLIIFVLTALYAEEQVTIYNDNFALIRQEAELELSTNVIDYYLEDVAATIEQKSIIIDSRDKFEVISQNFEYDLANSNKIMEKYIGKEVEVLLKNGDRVTGLLQFTDISSLGIVENNSKKLFLLRTEETMKIELASLPGNFFLKPTLHWILSPKTSGKVKVPFSYMCNGISWDVVYNCVWDNEYLRILPWVTINNRTGKAYNDVKLKLIAGEVNKIKTYDMYQRVAATDNDMEMAVSAKASPEFTEKEFHDFHLYTLDSNVTINNNQTKQIVLFPEKRVKGKGEYRYRTFSNEVISVIKFTNSAKNGLGLPLPAGIIKIYKEDKDDQQTEFIGEDRIEHTPIEEEIEVTTGNAFDLIGKTTVVNQTSDRTSNTRTINVKLKNRSKVEKNLFITHGFNSVNWEILQADFQYKAKNSTEMEINVTLKPGEERELNWKEINKY